MTPTETLLHAREQFSFVVQAPIACAWPLFGASAEEAWAEDWRPKFL